MCGTMFYLLSIVDPGIISFNYLDFGLLTLSTAMIAAAGNIINDYFDVRADRINKPEKLIITKYIKRRWAIVSHWILNGLAFVVGIYLSIKYSTFSFMFIHLISINLLWFYSMYFKRKALIGNLIVAFLTSLIPILALTFIYFTIAINSQSDDSIAISGILDVKYSIVHIVAFFAFTQNLAREIIKDIQDIEGDKLIYVRSLPMIIGVKKTLTIVIVLLMILPVFLVLSYIYPIDQPFLPAIEEQWLFLLAACINILVILLIILGNGDLKLQDRMIKISMLLGILSFYQFALS